MATRMALASNAARPNHRFYRPHRATGDTTRPADEHSGLYHYWQKAFEEKPGLHSVDRRPRYTQTTKFLGIGRRWAIHLNVSPARPGLIYGTEAS